MGNAVNRMLVPREIYRWLSSGAENDNDKTFAAVRIVKTTLIRFWRELLSEILDEDALAMLDSAKEKRSRSLSNIMNRSGSAGVMSPLYEAFAKGIDSAKFLRLTVAWLETLNKQEPDWFLFMDSLCAFEDACMEGDSAITPDIRAHLMALRDEVNEAFAADYQSQGFYCCVQLAWLTVYAFLGSHMDSRRIALFRKSDDLSASRLYMKYRHVTFGRFVPVVLTSRECEACRQALVKEAYVPCPANVVEALYERLEERGKVLVSAVGGMGKTELVRQVLVRCSELGRYSRLAFVQYTDDLISSFKNAFRELKNVEPQEVLRAAGELLDKAYSGRTLLIINNARIDNDPELWQMVACFGCDVLVTSRQRELEGFVEFYLSPMGVGETRRLLEISCGFPLSDSREEFERLHRRVNGHPLAVVLLGKALKARSLTVAALNKEIDTSGYQNLQLIHRGESESFIEKLKKVFSTTIADPKSSRLLVLFSMLDFQNWTARNVETLLLDAEPDAKKVSELLYRNHLNGWLELNQKGYAMQPAIAEAMRTECGMLQDYPMLEARLREMFAQDVDELYFLGTDAIAGANMVAFLAENGKGVPEEIILGAMVYSHRIDFLEIEERLLPFCAKSENKETRFVAHCYERASILTKDRSSKEANDVAPMLKEAEDIDFSNPLAILGVGSVAAMLDDWNEEIFELLGRALKSCRNSIPRGEALLQYANMLIESSGDFMKAKGLMAQAEEMDPEQKALDFQMLLQFAICFAEDKVGIQTEYLAKVERLAEKMQHAYHDFVGNGEWMIFYSFLADICYKQGLPEKTEIYALHSIGEYEKITKDSVRNDPNNLWRLAQAYRRANQPENALEVNHRIMRSLKRYDRLSPVVLHAWFQRGVAFYETGKYKQSLQAFKECIERMNECKQPDPFGRVTAYFEIARTLDAMNKKEKAQEYIDAILEDYKALQQYGFTLQEDLRPMLAYVHED